MQLATALVIDGFGKYHTVVVGDKSYIATAKSKKKSCVVGDLVQVQIINAEQAQIMKVLERRNIIYRSDANRSKEIASNIDIMLIIIAVKPTFNYALLDNALICASYSNIKPIIVINKIDLAQSQEFISRIEDIYAKYYSISKISATDESCQIIKELISDKNSLLIGQSGMGKSTIINNIYPNAQARTKQITKSETSGSHTTTNATLYQTDFGNIIDSPGIQEFGLYHLEVEDLASYFPEFTQYLGNCKFSNCTHDKEPNCNLKNNLDKIAVNRYECYLRLLRNLKNKKHY